ncbi:MAG: hypothetical protein QXE01_03635 [Sulfolobales archaeon]
MKLESAVDRNVFYTAAEMNKPPIEASTYSIIAIQKIFIKCHTMVASEEFLRDIVNKLENCKDCNRHRAYEIVRLLNHMRT